MRLIDADCMKENIKAKYNPGFKDILGQWIDKQSTVDCVPRDQVEEALNKMREMRANEWNGQFSDYVEGCSDCIHILSEVLENGDMESN